MSTLSAAISVCIAFLLKKINLGDDFRNLRSLPASDNSTSSEVRRGVKLSQAVFVALNVGAGCPYQSRLWKRLG